MSGSRLLRGARRAATLGRGRGMFRAGLLDWRAAGAPIGLVIGPVAVTDERDVLARLRALVTGEPARRIGLRPDPASRMWRWRAPDETWLRGGRDVVAGDVEGAVRRCATSRPATPVSAGITDGHLVAYVDHGVGDGCLVLEAVVALTIPGPPPPGGLVVDHAQTYVRWPVAAVLRGAAADPRALVADVRRHLAEHRRPRPTGSGGEPAGAAAPTAAPGARRPAVVFEQAEPEFLERLVAYRATAPGRPSIGALLAYSMAASFADHVPDLASEAGVLVDMRRFLPAGRESMANLAAVVDVPIGHDPVAFTQAFTAAASSRAVPVRLAVSLLLAALRRRGSPAAAHQDPAAPVRLTISDVTRHPAVAAVAWDPAADPADRVLAIALPPAGARHMSLVLAQVGSRIQATVAFDESVVPADDVRAAVRAGLAASWLDADAAPAAVGADEPAGGAG